VVDPTGAGDTFAGGFVGYVAQQLSGGLTEDVLRRAMAYGTALASFNVEEFGTERMPRLTVDEIRARVKSIHALGRFELRSAELAAA
jgi:sugar/nucleoside kinase (ribokinase family)